VILVLLLPSNEAVEAVSVSILAVTSGIGLETVLKYSEISVFRRTSTHLLESPFTNPPAIFLDIVKMCVYRERCS
jgi:hypothetical protein